MGDFPDTFPAPFGVSYWSSYNGIHSIGAATGTLGTPASATYPAANRAIFIPFRLLMPIRITKLWALNGATVSGNFDLGIYNRAGRRLVSIGSTAQSGVNAIQTITLGTAVRLGVGLFYMAIACDNTTATFFRVSGGGYTAQFQVLGTAQQATAFPLPATATFATIASSWHSIIGFISEEG